MPTSLRQAMIESAQGAQSTHNKVTSNAAAMLAIRLASRYLLRKTDSEAPAQPASSTAAASSSSAASSSVVVPTSEMTIEMTGNTKALERMSRVRTRYEGRVKSSFLEAPTKAWLAATLSSRTLSRELDRVTLVEEHNGQQVSTEWYLPLPEVYAVVLSALIDLDEKRWPVPPGSNAKNERMLRLQEFDRINNALAKATPRICSTGIRHAWLMALDGYEGKRLPLNAEDVLMQGLFDFMVREVLGKQMNINLPDGRDPVGAERATFNEHFQSLFLPWAYGTMPNTVVNAIKNAGGSDAARDFVLARFRTIGIAPDELMMQKINGYCSEEGLQSIPCHFIPILAALERHAKRHTLALSSGTITATGLRPLAEDTLAWLQGVNFSSESLANPAHEKDPLSILYLVLRLHDTLYQYKDYKNLLDVCDMPEDNKNAWVDALHVYSQCLHNPDLTLASLLDDTVMLEERLRAFERGFAMWRNGAYHDFISNYAANWFAASGDSGITTRASLFTKLCDLYFRENTEGSNSIPAIRLKDAMLAEWLARAGEDGILEVTPYQINRILLHALCYPANSWSPLFQQCLPNLLAFIRNRCNQEQNTAGDALSRDSWPEALLAQVERIAAPESTGEPSLPVLLTPGTITPASSLDIAILLAASTDVSETVLRNIVKHQGFEPNATSNEGLAPFHLAATRGNTRFAAALLERGANYKVNYKNFYTPLNLALNNKHMLFVQWFLQTLSEHERINVLITTNQYGTNLMHQVASIRPKLLKQILDCLPEGARTGTVMEKTPFNNTVLHLTAKKCPKTLKTLLDRLPEAERANALMIKNGDGHAVLHQVMEYDPELLKQLFDCLPEASRIGAAMVQNNDGNTVLHRAVQCSPKTLKKLLDRLPEAERADAVMIKNGDGHTVLHQVLKFCPELLEQLLDCIPEVARAGIVMIQNNDGNTALHLVANNFASLKLLHDWLPKAARADVLMIRNRYGCSVLDYISGHFESLNLLLDCLPETTRANVIMKCNVDGDTILHRAVKISPNIVKQLLDYLSRPAKANAVMACNRYGSTVLHHAAHYPDSLKLLLDCLPKVARTNAVIKRTHNTEPVLQSAAGYPESLKLLLNCLPEVVKTDAVMARNRNDENMLYLSAKYPESLKLLIDCLSETARAEAVLIRNKNGNTVLHEAANNPGSLNLLLTCLPETKRAGVIMTKNDDGNTALHWATKSPEALKLLLDCLPETAKADAVMARNNYHETLLHWAVDHPKSLKHLLNCLPMTARADALMTKDCDGKTVLDLVKHPRCSKTLNLLEAIVKQAKQQTATQFSADSPIPNYDAGTTRTLPSSSSDIDTFSPLGSHSLFNQGSMRLQDPGNPEEECILRR